MEEVMPMQSDTPVWDAMRGARWKKTFDRSWERTMARARKSLEAIVPDEEPSETEEK